MYYFGYGSNINHEQMKIRCPNAKFIKKVFLKNYKFVYDGYSKSHKGAVDCNLPEKYVKKYL